MGRRLPKPLRKTALAVAAVMLLLALLEGGCTLAFLAWDLATKEKDEVAERQHTRHDDELGWIAAADVSYPDFYGEGLHLRTNARGFRNDGDTPDATPAGKVRVVCSGDSFTLGYGVSNEDTWTAKLAALDDRLDVVNMGQGGYGIGQAWMWYERERERLEHDVHVFSFIDNDFERLRMSRFFGYSKPVLRVTDGRLEITGTPVPRREAIVPWMNRKLPLFERLSLWRLLGNLQRMAGSGPDSGLTPLDEAREVVGLVFAKLRESSAGAKRKLVLVWFPTKLECSNGGSLPWRKFVTAEAKKQGIALLDMTPTFHELPMRRLDGLFISSRDVTFPGASGHYTAAGNTVVARRLLQWLREEGIL